MARPAGGGIDLVPVREGRLSNRSVHLIDTLLIGGKGTIGSGLRTYLPQLDTSYRVTSVDLPGAEDNATDPDAHRYFIDLDVSADDAC